MCQSTIVGNRKTGFGVYSFSTGFVPSEKNCLCPKTEEDALACASYWENKKRPDLADQALDYYIEYAEKQKRLPNKLWF